ncbi:unnamed protein product [Schistocephalus solidus]|uniref:Endo/exonuclease/phosphatase domain-containing protein n=1 Tax=Schistocephalus solidus TaxID=70667 RepID=A0A183T8V1_SCHSO|nr:unnamed protein product [Schistocephalus solidus]
MVGTDMTQITVSQQMVILKETCARLPIMMPAGFFPAATPTANATTGGLNQVRVSGVVCFHTWNVCSLATTLCPLPSSLHFHPLPFPSLLFQSHSYFTSYLSFPSSLSSCLSLSLSSSPLTLPSSPTVKKTINDRLMSLRLLLRREKFAIIISAYALPLPMSISDAAKDKFYEDLHALLATGPKADKLIVLGDFNARVGTDHAVWQEVLDPHGLGGRNDNGHLLL